MKTKGDREGDEFVEGRRTNTGDDKGKTGKKELKKEEKLEENWRKKEAEEDKSDERVNRTKSSFCHIFCAGLQGVKTCRLTEP